MNKPKDFKVVDRKAGSVGKVTVNIPAISDDDLQKLKESKVFTKVLKGNK